MLAPETIARLTKDEKLRFLDIIAEKKRRLRESGAIYAPNEGQLPVHKSPVRLRCVFSGNGAGKTALGANEAIWFAQGYNPITETFTKVPARVIVVLDSPDKVTDQWLPELCKWTNLTEDQLHKRGRPYVNRISLKNGSEILFFFHQQEPLVFESIECDYIIFDEPPPRPIYIALRRGARKKNREPRFLIIGTPISQAWLRKEIAEPWSKGELTNTECFRFGTEVNRVNLADGYIEEYSQILSEKEKAIRLKGEFYDLEGLALAHLFERDSHIVEPFPWDEANPVVVAIDPHPTKPHHAVMVGCDKDGLLYYLKETKRKAVARDFACHLKEWYRGYRIVDIVADSLGSAEGTGGEGFKSFLQVLREEGVLARATSWEDKHDEDFIERIRSALAVPVDLDNFGRQIPKLRIFAGNNGIISDIENVQWIKYRGVDEYKPKLDIADKDFLSSLKYALATNITPLKGKAKIYRPTERPAEIYGLAQPQDSWRARFRKIRTEMNRRKKQLDDDDW
jgi:hypothetical protein